MKIKTHTEAPSKSVWHRSTAAGRWYGFGRYYGMFPQSFVHDAVINLTKPEETVLDPFCGRGNGTFAATVLGRDALGIDVNPIAWLYAAAKLQPAGTPEQVTARLSKIAKARRPNDRRSRSRFETMAWAPPVRALLRAARRELDWQDSVVDRTLMAFITLHMQDKLGCGLSKRHVAYHSILAHLRRQMVDGEGVPSTTGRRTSSNAGRQNTSSLSARCASANFWNSAVR